MPRRLLAPFVTFVVVAISVVFTISQLQPHLLVTNTLTAGGDMGAHVWAPQYLRDHLLPHWRISGWSPDWYDGFPALTFYFPLPPLLVVLLNVVVPYGVAFKVITVSGVVSLPIAAWAFGRLARLPFPIPACLAAATVPFLFDTGYTILGGNIASTLAGEYAFSVGLSIALVFLGLVAGGLETGKRRAWAAALLGATILCHILPTILAFVGGVVLLMMSVIRHGREGRQGLFSRLRWAVPVGIAGSLLSGIWLIPFVLRRAYLNDMGWEKIGTGVDSGIKLYDQTVTHYSDALFPDKILWVLVGGFLGAAIALYLRRPVGIFFTIMAAIAAFGFVLMPQGALWNARVLPFWYLFLYLLSGYLVGEVGLMLGGGLKAVFARHHQVAGRDVAYGIQVVTPIVALLTALAIVSPALGVTWWPGSNQTATNFIPGWASWNYSGYQGKATYPEYRSVIDMMSQIGRDRGCGRVMWEYEPTLDRLGTPMALMLLPLWTHDCMGSMEGLFFESSATVPYHFLNQAELSKSPSSAMRGLPYGSLNVADGITKLQLMGVRYYLAVSPEAQQQAALDSRLSLVGTVLAAPATDGTARTWNAYEIANSAMVAPLSNLPAVMTKVPKTAKAWQDNSVQWYQDSTRYNVPLAASGPPSWPRVDNASDVPLQVPVEPAKVGLITSSDDRISFTVDKPGTPILVRASYFPNWQLRGAKGPYRVTPNLMVVVPTSTHVSLHYGRTPVDYLGILSTLVGVAGLMLMARGDRRLLDSTPSPHIPDR